MSEMVNSTELETQSVHTAWMLASTDPGSEFPHLYTRSITPRTEGFRKICPETSREIRFFGRNFAWFIDRLGDLEFFVSPESTVLEFRFASVVQNICGYTLVRERERKFRATGELLESSTEQSEFPRDLEFNIWSLFEDAKEELFEDGVESEFSKKLTCLVERYGKDALLIIEDLVFSEDANPEISSEAMRWLGLMYHPSTYQYRLNLLISGLFSLSPKIRDGAALGLAFLEDPDAIPYIHQAVSREEIEELRQDLEQILEQLGNTSHAVRLEAD